VLEDPPVSEYNRNSSMYSHDDQHNNSEREVGDMPISKKFLHRLKIVDPPVQGNFMPDEFQYFYRFMSGQSVAFHYGFYPAYGFPVIQTSFNRPDKYILVIKLDLFFGRFDNNIITLFIHVIITG
jgi:hypothetical protein